MSLHPSLVQVLHTNIELHYNLWIVAVSECAKIILLKFQMSFLTTFAPLHVLKRLIFQNWVTYVHVYTISHKSGRAWAKYNNMLTQNISSQSSPSMLFQCSHYI